MSSISAAGSNSNAAKLMNLQHEKLAAQSETANQQRRSRETVSNQLVQDTVNMTQTSLQIQQQTNKMIGSRVDAFA